VVEVSRARTKPRPAAVFAEQRRSYMHWYNPKEGKVDDVGAPSTDEEALGMLSGTRTPAGSWNATWCCARRGWGWSRRWCSWGTA
jgi:hypothetical protein